MVSGTEYGPLYEIKTVFWLRLNQLSISTFFFVEREIINCFLFHGLKTFCLTLNSRRDPKPSQDRSAQDSPIGGGFKPSAWQDHTN